MNKRPIYIPFAGPALLESPLLNKGGAFSREERQQFNLEGLLPHKIETIEEQLLRARVQLNALKTDIDKHVYLRDLQDTNETLYFRFVIENLAEIMPLIYTPTVGQACQLFSIIYRRKRGVFVSYDDRDRIDEMLQNATKKNVKVIVVTDSERILGLGDQGIGGMGIPIGKLALYTACGGISPAYTLPITLDVGTNNQALIDDPMYLGLKHPRISGDDYVEFIDTFIKAVQRRWPHAIVQFEDFAQSTATPLLARYQDKLCCFNDDIQGTAAVTVGTLLTACMQKNEQLKDQVIALVGSGSAGCGIAEQIIAQMQDEGLSEAEARQRIFMLNSKGLLLDNAEGIRDFQQKLCQPAALLKTWQCENPESKTATLSDIVNNAKPTILIGVSGQPGIFTEQLIRAMNNYCERPIILPLSNPTSQVEALPSHLIEWTQGRAIIATGSPFAPVNYHGKQHIIAQCNNSYIFPGLGLGAIAAKATRITNNMMMTSSRALAQYAQQMHSESESAETGLLPPLGKIRDVSKVIAKAVFKQAIADGVALNVPEDIIDKEIDKNFWHPEYRTYKRTSF